MATDGGPTAVTWLAGVAALIAVPIAIALLVSAWHAFKLSRTAPALPDAARCWSVSLQRDTWGFVQWMNHYARRCDLATHDAVHALLWALAHTDSRSAHISLISGLVSDFETATGEPDLAAVRSATARIWALIP